jgi:Arm DNA-binding domain
VNRRGDDADRQAEGLECRTRKEARHVRRWRRSLSAGDRRRREVVGVSLWVSERDPKTGEPVKDPESGKTRGTSREMGLGSFTVVSLDEARELASDARRLRHQGLDPIEARREAKQTAALERAKALKFRDAASAYIAAHRVGWRNEKHAAQWTTSKRALPRAPWNSRS